MMTCSNTLLRIARARICHRSLLALAASSMLWACLADDQTANGPSFDTPDWVTDKGAKAASHWYLKELPDTSEQGVTAFCQAVGSQTPRFADVAFDRGVTSGAAFQGLVIGCYQGKVNYLARLTGITEPNADTTELTITGDMYVWSRFADGSTVLKQDANRVFTVGVFKTIKHCIQNTNGVFLKSFLDAEIHVPGSNYDTAVILTQMVSSHLTGHDWVEGATCE